MRFFQVHAAVVALLAAGAVLPSAWAEYDPKGKRDPLVPLLNSEGQRIYPPGFDEETPTGLQGLTLQGIVFDPTAESYAIINGRLVREEDEIDGMKVAKIGPRTVTVLAGGQEHQLVIQELEEPESPPTPKEMKTP